MAQFLATERDIQGAQYHGHPGSFSIMTLKSFRRFPIVFALHSSVILPAANQMCTKSIKNVYLYNKQARSALSKQVDVAGVRENVALSASSQSSKKNTCNFYHG